MIRAIGSIIGIALGAMDFYWSIVMSRQRIEDLYTLTVFVRDQPAALEYNVPKSRIAERAVDWLALPHVSKIIASKSC